MECIGLLMKFPGALDHATLNFLHSFFFDCMCVCSVHLEYSIKLSILKKISAKNVPLWRKEVWVNGLTGFSGTLSSCTPFVENIYFLIDCCSVLCLVAQSCPTLCDPMDCSLPGSSVHGVLQEEYWSGLPCPPPGDPPGPGIEPASLMFTALAGGFFTKSPTWEALSLSESEK